ncbi:MAG TPA: hypothetical protein VGZ52_02770 [Acidimicrobiales bacterium]|jgi:uncharacterized membrane protein YeaQ/YmgE (transglycosylase-associated protein family)|nr:hypothetical protein [Acidimicrobiales bacterium]
MLLVAYVLIIVSFSLVIGALARLVHPGHDDLGLVATVGVGLVGLVVGSLLTRALWLRSGLLGLGFAVGVAALLVWAVTPDRRTV